MEVCTKESGRLIQELGRMLERFGLDHAPDPEDLDHPPLKLPK